MIGRRRERGSGISVLAARHDDDDTQLNSFNYCYLTLEILFNINLFAHSEVVRNIAI